jgi:hypothetical protein
MPTVPGRVATYASTAAKRRRKSQSNPDPADGQGAVVDPVDETGGTGVGVAEPDVTGTVTGTGAGAATGRWQPAVSAQHATATHSADPARDHLIIASRLADSARGRRARVAAQFAW